MVTNQMTRVAARPRTTLAKGWLTSRLLATLAALAVALAAWIPWVGAVGTATNSGHTRRVALQLSPGDVGDVLGTFGWSALTVAGVLICPLLWARRDRLISLLAVVAYAVWVLAFTGFATSRVGALYQPDILFAPDLGTAGLDVTSQRQLLPGFFFACAGMLLSLAACLALFLGSARLRAGSGGAGSERRIITARSQLPAAGVLTVAVVLWLVSSLVLPWATVDCTSVPLVFGRCTGIPFNTTLGAGIRSTTTVFDPLAAKYAALVLLSGSAVTLLVALWRRRLTRRLCAWITFWLIACASGTTLAHVGVSAVIAHPADQGLPAGSWSGDNGLSCALLALVLGLCGVVYLWVAAVRSSTPGT